MPPIKKHTREDIINATYNLIKEEGASAVNARRIAKILGCSVQPIFHNFTSMEELNEVVYEKIYDKYIACMIDASKKEEKPYKEMGIAYIKFAKDYPEFFKMIFMTQTKLDAKNFIKNDDMGNGIIASGQKLTGLSEEEQKQFHIKVWIFTHGIACMVATKTVEFTDQEIANLLEETVRQMIIGYRKERGKIK